MKKRKLNFHLFVKYIVLIALSVVILFPLGSLVINSLKTERELAINPVGFPEEPTLKNYATVYKQANIPKATRISVFLTVISVGLQLIIGTLAAFALTKMKFKRHNVFKTIFMAPMMLSAQALVLPTFLIFSRLGLIDNLLSAIFIYTATGLPIAIFILTKFMASTVPDELCDAANVDGASSFTTLVKIVLPLMKTPLATVAILNGINVWNDFFVPFMYFPSGKLDTLPLSIYNFQQMYHAKYTLISADIVFIILPIIIFYLLMQRYIVGGVTAGALTAE